MLDPEFLGHILQCLLEEYRSYAHVESFYGQESIVFDGGDESQLIDYYVKRIIKEKGNL